MYVFIYVKLSVLKTISSSIFFFLSSNLVARISPFKVNKWEYQSSNLDCCILNGMSLITELCSRGHIK
jgi:Iap family predicted aminopeptidase